MTRPRLERYRQHFLDHFDDYIMVAEFDKDQHLIVYANPYINFEETIMQVCEGLFDTVDFPDHLNLHLYSFGSNEFIRIVINPSK